MSIFLANLNKAHIIWAIMDLVFHFAILAFGEPNQILCSRPLERPVSHLQGVDFGMLAKVLGGALDIYDHAYKGR